MRYRIADSIIFDPEERTLTLETHDESVHLPIPASRLLEFMLKRKDTLHERDELLTEVWDKYGLKGSGSNLNQYISLLRRTLSGMNCDDFFITVPKVGFRVNPAIEVVAFEHLPEAVVLAQELDDKDEGHAPATAGGGQFGLSGRKIAYGLALILVALALFIYGKKDVWNIRQIEPLHAHLDNSCKIIYLNKTSSATREEINTKARMYLTERGRECSDNDVFVASVVNAEQTRGIARSFLSLCRSDYRGHIVDCNSLYSRR